MLREIEVSAAIVGELVIDESAGGCGTRRSTCGQQIGGASTWQAADSRLRMPLATLSGGFGPTVAPSAQTTWAVSAEGSGQESLKCPLVPDYVGMHVTKRAMTAAFVLVAGAAGAVGGTRITGHSPRVTGAQLMARAGISEWRVQVFGRWVSSAVLGYLRESLIRDAAGALAQEVVLARMATPCSVAEVAPLLKADGATTRAALERAVAQGAAPPGQEGQEESVAALRCELAAVRADLAAMAARAVPEVVVCTASGKAHVVANACVSHCGWQWSATPNSFRP